MPCNACMYIYVDRSAMYIFIGTIKEYVDYTDRSIDQMHAVRREAGDHCLSITIYIYIEICRYMECIRTCMQARLQMNI